jgi:hypothetical protein
MNTKGENLDTTLSCEHLSIQFSKDANTCVVVVLACALASIMGHLGYTRQGDRFNVSTVQYFP